DGINFFRFPAVSDIEDTTQLVMQGIDCSLVNNLAGKYVAGYGTPFDLEDLKNQFGLDVNDVRYVRVIDAVGSINDLYASHDINGHKVNDPWPTPFASSGFDLDAVGVINGTSPNAIANIGDVDSKIYPNPAVAGQTIHIDIPTGSKVDVFNISGQLITELLSTNNGQLTTKLPEGIYFLNIETASSHFNAKLVVE
ncbi:MAG: hypothetical protein JWO06_1, partial [Bacteroidota bacterium]|nr:hypothetical protein [Bacteroidota bacterium]